MHRLLHTLARIYLSFWTVLQAWINNRYDLTLYVSDEMARGDGGRGRFFFGETVMGIKNVDRVR